MVRPSCVVVKVECGKVCNKLLTTTTMMTTSTRPKTESAVALSMSSSSRGRQHCTTSPVHTPTTPEHMHTLPHRQRTHTRAVTYVHRYGRRLQYTYYVCFFFNSVLPINSLYTILLTTYYKHTRGSSASPRNNPPSMMYTQTNTHTHSHAHPP